LRKKFIINLIFLVSLNLLIKPFWIFGIDMAVQNTVGASEYGFYFALFNFSLLLNIFLDLGITNFNNRNIARHNQLLTKHFSNIVGFEIYAGYVLHLANIDWCVFHWL
jgi:O-antigen/teichoic acid export membrane protein